MSWKRLVLVAAAFGAGFALFAAAIVGAVYWYANRPRPWNDQALKGSFATLELVTHPDQKNYEISFIYNVENTTNRNYEFIASNLTVFANITEEWDAAAQKNIALSKDFGDLQASEPTLEGPAFIPAKSKARVRIRAFYQYPQTYTEKDKDDNGKMISTASHRLKELDSIVLFDERNHYRIDLPKGWKEIVDKMKN